MNTQNHSKLVLASSSRYRTELLGRILPHFSSCSADIDESLTIDEPAYSLAERLARQKALKVAQQYPDHWVLGCDQVAILNTNSETQILGKPGSFEKATVQLQACSGKTVEFYTACSLLCEDTGEQHDFSDSYWLTFKHLEPATIYRYLQREKPYDCAGSIKSEGLGVALIERYQGDDPSTLIGLPLIKLVDQLESIGIDILG